MKGLRILNVGLSVEVHFISSSGILVSDDLHSSCSSEESIPFVNALNSGVVASKRQY